MYTNIFPIVFSSLIKQVHVHMCVYVYVYMYMYVCMYLNI